MRRLLLLLLLPVVAAGGSRTASAGPDLRPIVLTAHPGRVPKGGEKQLCHRFRVPRAHDVEIGRVQVFVRGGSHHVHLYRPYNGAVVYPPHSCPFAVDFDKWELVAATQNSLLDWPLPDGVAINLSAHQPLMIQTHFVNAGALRTRGNARAKIVLHPIDPATVRAHAGAIFAQDRMLTVPPGRSTAISRCMLTGAGPDAHALTILALTGHYHYRGVGFEVYRVHGDGTLGERVYLHEGFDDPTLTMYKGANQLILQPGEGLEWRCTYQNNTGATLQFGANTQRNEHCNLFGFYTPTGTPQEAIDCIHQLDDQGHEEDVRLVAR